MKKLIVAAVLAGSLISFEAQAQERAGSAVLGAVSGAIVFGPLGAAAGALVGYTAGPEIGRSWRAGQPAPRSRVRRTARSGDVAKQPAAASVTPRPVGNTQPPVAKAPETVSSAKTAPPVTPAPATIAGTKPVPPIQTFE